MKKTSFIVLTALAAVFFTSFAFAFGNDAPIGNSATVQGTLFKTRDAVTNVDRMVTRDINNARAQIGERTERAERFVKNAKAAYDNVTNPDVIRAAKESTSEAVNEYKKGYNEFRNNFGSVVKEQTKMFANNIKNHVSDHKKHFRESTMGITGGIGNAYQQAGGAISGAISRTINRY